MVSHFYTALLAGALAGTTVDLALYPLDTLKTRLQSRAGFFASGGFRGVYCGLGSVAVGSAPGAAIFFVAYEGSKSRLAAAAVGAGAVGAGRPPSSPASTALDHMIAASVGEVAACAVRVPTEVVKQRAQAGMHASSAQALMAVLSARHAGDGLARRVRHVWAGLYRGWGITVMREVPFTVIQFPLWEAMKARGARRRSRNAISSSGNSSQLMRPVSTAAAAAVPASDDVPALESALYGSLSGAVAAFATTPLDVIKTRVMLEKGRTGAMAVLGRLLREEGWRPLFAGVGPRVAWISVGGAVFLGTYTWAVGVFGTTWSRRSRIDDWEDI